MMSVRSLLAALALAGVACGKADGGPPGSVPDCEEVLVAGGDGSGYLTCDDGSAEREVPSDCPASGVPLPCTDPGDGLGCTDDAGCGGGRSCIQGSPGYCYCVAPCQADADCGAGELCLCNYMSPFDDLNRCIPAECRGAADCPDGPCGLQLQVCDGLEAACHSGEDKCTYNQHCAGNQVCLLEDGRFVCREPTAGCTGG